MADRTLRQSPSHVRRRALLWGIVLACSVPLAAAALWAQARAGAPAASPPTPDARPQFRAGANLVRVDVFPTASGAPVRDLTAADFEVLEDGALQKVESFEHVEIRGQIPQSERREPNTVAESRAMAEDPRSRIFVVFLDTYHTELAGSHRMQKVLVDLLDRIIGPDDLFAVMTPDMSAGDIALARRTETTAGMLSKYWNWGRRDQPADLDPVEEEYTHCFPESSVGQDSIKWGDRSCRDPTDPTGTNAVGQARNFYNGVAKEMIARRRERRVLDALGDLSLYLQGLRDERKAIVAVSDGWLLYRPNEHLARIGPCDDPPTGPETGIGPDGRIRNTGDRDKSYASRYRCEADRHMLSQLDDFQVFRDLLDRANRANVSFYPIDSRGLPAADTQIYEDTPTTVGVPVHVDKAMLTARIDNLRTLADATDGLAVLDSNDLDRGVRRIVDDLTSYYLLGYYSTNAKLDGRFRSIKVRVKRPGVQVRARRGYKAATDEEIAHGKALAAKAAVSGPPPALQAAIASLSSARGDVPFLTSVSWIAAPPDGAVPGAKGRVWVTGELDASAARSPEWAGGGQAELLLTAQDGVKLAERSVPIAAPVRAIEIAVPDIALGPGEYSVRLRVRPTAGGLPYMDTIRFTVPEKAPRVGTPRLLRRGLQTGIQYLPTADVRFRRTDRLRLELPLFGTVDGVQAELVNRAGQAMPVPVAATTRTDGGALTWATADLVLAPLAPGDYAIRLSISRGTNREEAVAAFRVVP